MRSKMMSMGAASVLLVSLACGCVAEPQDDEGAPAAENADHSQKVETARSAVVYGNPPGYNPATGNPPGTGVGYGAGNPPGYNPPGYNPATGNPPGYNPPGTGVGAANPPGYNPPGTNPATGNPPGYNPPGTY